MPNTVPVLGSMPWQGMMRSPRVALDQCVSRLYVSSSDEVSSEGCKLMKKMRRVSWSRFESGEVVIRRHSSWAAAIRVVWMEGWLPGLCICYGRQSRAALAAFVGRRGGSMDLKEACRLCDENFQGG